MIPWATARHERLFLGLGALTTIALLFRAGPSHQATLSTLGLTLGYGAVLAMLGPRFRRLRYLAAYLFALGFYAAVAQITPALGGPLFDDTLLAADRFLFRETPSVALSRDTPVWAVEIWSGLYLSYHLWLHGALLWAVRKPEARGQLLDAVYTAFAVGYAGYLLVPAIGPERAFPALFGAPLVGGSVTALKDAVIEGGTCLYDAFPSLHVLIPLVLLEFDRRDDPRRFRRLLPLAAGLFASTLTLRYHYAVDLVGALLAWGIARRLGRPGWV